MSDVGKKRQFSKVMRDANSLYLKAEQSDEQQINVGFILLENFSMMAFTAAVDTLVTANLVQSETLFKVSTFGLSTTAVTSDLGIDISTQGNIGQIALRGPSALNILVVCGGFRCSLKTQPSLNYLLKNAHQQQIILGGIWNGVISLAQAHLLNDTPCALHPDNHALMREQFENVQLSDKSFVVTPKRISCADALSAMDMMLDTIEQLKGQEIVRAVREILSCNRSQDQDGAKLVQNGDNQDLPPMLRNAIQLMNSNIEEPLAIEELAQYLSTSRRQIERLFKLHLDTSPSRHYLEIRLTYARRLLVQSEDSITNIAIACGFVSSNHFSNCFRDYFKMPPSTARKQQQNKSI